MNILAISCFLNYIFRDCFANIGSELSVFIYLKVGVNKRVWGNFLGDENMIQLDCCVVTKLCFTKTCQTVYLKGEFYCMQNTLQYLILRQI